MVKKYWWALLILFLAVFFVANSYLKPNSKTFSGSIHQIGGGWGIQSDMDWFRPLAQRQFRLVNLSEPYQYEGLRVQGKFKTVEIVGSMAWGIFLAPVTISKE